MSNLSPDASPINPIDPAATQWRDGTAGRFESPLLVLLHGLGSFEGDLIGLAPYLPERFTIASLRAPLPHGDGWAWHSPGNQNSAGDPHTRASARGVLAWLDALEGRSPSITVGGFSQGGCMSVQSARLAPERFSAVLQLSGYVAVGDAPGDAELAARDPRLPLFWAHGTQDQVITREAIQRTAAFLPEHFAVEAHTYPMAHQVAMAELTDISAFLDEHVP